MKKIKGFAILSTILLLMMNFVLPVKAAENVIGDTLKYDTSKTVNNGEEITLEYWTWNDGDPAIALSEEYMQLHPNVKINVVQHPWEDFWTKLPLSLQSGGPALFNIHNSQDNLLKPYLAAYELDIEALKEDFNGVEPHIREDGKVYYIDSVINTGNIYYNKKMWEEAGLTEDDIPTTWDEFREVAKKLTITEGDKLVQAGFNWNGNTYSGIYEGLNYQKGALLFNEDGTVNYDNDITKENLQFLIDLYEVDGVGSKDFGTDAPMSFGNSQSAMTYQWGWFKNELDSKYPDVDYGVFATPTFTDEVPFAYDRYNGESTPGINANQSEEQQAVAQDFINFILANDEYELKAAEAFASYPTKKTLSDHEVVTSNPILTAIGSRVERLIWPGPFPATVETSATKAMEDVVFNNANIDEALSNAQDQMDRDMRQSQFKSLESSYQFFDEFK